MGLDHLWAGWRSSYIESVDAGVPEGGAVAGERGTVPADVTDEAPETGSLFERILRLDDQEGFIVRRGARAAVILNAYPYTNGHVLVMPVRAAARLDELDTDELLELWQLVTTAVSAIETAYGCDGVNVGVNLGKAAGAGVPDHLHVHVLPRWEGDTNFMTAVADTRVLPEPLSRSWEKLRAAWPEGPDAASTG